MSPVVEIVYDIEKKKLRAKAMRKSGWVQFPNELRIPGARYQVDGLREDNRGFWHVVGNIRKLD